MRNLNLTAVIAGLALSVLGSTASAEVRLRVFEWEDYVGVHKQAFEAYAKAQGKDVVIDLIKGADGAVRYIGSADDIVEVLEAGGADVVTPTVNYYHQEEGRLLKLLAPLDTSRITNYGVLSVKGLAAFKDSAGKVYGVPYVGGSYGLAYNADRADRPSSWSALLSPEAKGKYQITGDQFEANVYQAAILAGVPSEAVYDYAKMSPQQRDRTQEILNQLVAGSAGFWGGMPTAEEMNGLSYVTDYWFGVAAANAAGQKWRIVTTDEPSTVWLDAVSIAKPVAADPEKLEAAYLLIDYLIGAEAQLRALETFGSVIFNGAAYAQAGGGIDPETFFKPELFWRPLSTETRDAYREMWNKALAAAGKAG